MLLVGSFWGNLLPRCGDRDAGTRVLASGGSIPHITSRKTEKQLILYLSLYIDFESSI
jgi:hypothetical protein